MIGREVHPRVAERIPRIGSQGTCVHCGQPIGFDEVWGWLHTAGVWCEAMAEPGNDPLRRCTTPLPADGAR